MEKDSIPAGEFKTHCLRLLDEVSDGSHSFVITKHGRQVARLMPPLQAKKKKGLKAGFMKGSILYQNDIISPMTELWNLPE